MRIIVSWSNGVLPSVGETNVSVILYVYHSINLAKIYCTAWNEYVNDTTFHMLSWDAKVRVAYMSPALHLVEIYVRCDFLQNRNVLKLRKSNLIWILVVIPKCVYIQS